MSFAIFTDTSANLPAELVEQHHITIIPFSYYIDGQEHTCADPRAFDGKAYYDAIRNGLQVSTSQVNPQRYIDYMQPALAQGQDILFVGLSSGVSGSFNSATMAAAQLLEQFPERNIRLVDSLGAALGEGLLVVRAVECRDAGQDLNQTADFLEALRHRIYQVFTVADIMHLRRTGRITGATAFVGSVLQIQPILKGNDKGQIVSFAKTRGRKRAIEFLAEKYNRLAIEPQEQTVAITHADCPEEAEQLRQLILKTHPPKRVIMACHEPATGSHVGPGMLAVYFEGDTQVRQK